MFRALGKSKIAIVLAILFGVSLFFIKGGSRYSNFFNSDSIIATVSNTPISTTKFNRTMQLNIDKFNQMLGKQMTGDEIRAFQIHSLALSTLINEAIFEDEYDKIKFNIDEKVIAQKTKERIPQLYNSNNQLDELYLNTFLQQQQLKIEDIVQIINFETRDKFFNDAFFSIKYPKYFFNKLDNFDKHMRKILYVKLPINQINIDNILLMDATKKSEELKKYFNDNIHSYMNKEKRDIEYIIINKEKLDNDFTPTEFEIEQYYNSNKKLYYQNEKRSFVQFNFKTTKEAVNFKQKIKTLNLSQIIDYAKEKNLLFNEFENLEKNEILEEISDNLFKLNLKEQSDIIETSLAKHILILKSISLASQLTLDIVKENIIKTIINVENNNYFNEISNLISEKILNGESLSNIANSFNLKIEIVENLTQEFSKNDKSKELIFNHLVPIAFNSNKDFVSDINKINENISYLFNVTKITPESPKKFKEVENDLLKNWKISKKIKKIEEIIKVNENNVNLLSELSKEYNLKINKISLSKNSTDFPRHLIQNIFKSKKDQNVQNIHDEIIYITNVNQIIIPNESKDLTSFSMLNDLRAAFGEELRKNKKISTNDELINAIIEQF